MRMPFENNTSYQQNRIEMNVVILHQVDRLIAVTIIVMEESPNTIAQHNG